MPIYAYRCAACGHAKDVLQKISDPVLTVCPNCGAESFQKQVTAAGFQLKGSGWYVTDFRNGSQAPATGAAPAGGEGGKGDGAKGDGAKTEGAAAPKADAPAAATPAAAPSTPAASSGGGSASGGSQ
jgi:putative FmdB family regulatory protein